LSLFFSILQTLESLNTPYMIIGAYAGTIYGVTRITYDIVVDLNDAHIEALAAAYPSPRYYADPEMMRNSIQMGIMFNIIDGERGEKADPARWASNDVDPGPMVAMARFCASNTISYSSRCRGVKRPLAGKVREMSEL